MTISERTTDIATPDGAMTTHLFSPAGVRAPLVIFYMDGLAVRPSLLDMARRLASDGYAVAMPNLFYRSGPFAPFQGHTAFSDPAERERLMALIREVTPARALADTQAIIDAVEAERTADASRMGTVGYCMGGGPALSAAGRFPDRVRAAASYHGGRLATDAPDSPHVLASTARGTLYIGYAEDDTSFPESQRDRLAAALTGAGVAHAIERYHARHGFAIPDVPAYNRDAADRHWHTLLALFRDHLQ
jgi:carboxymethylenebutenolidase